MKMYYSKKYDINYDTEEEYIPVSLRESIEKTRMALDNAYAGFDYAVEADLIDSYIYEINSLDVRYEPAPTLQQLYLYCMRRLALGEARKDVALLEEIRKVIHPLHDAYAQLAKQNTAGPVMNNTQTVYAGLTYGRNTLTENMADQGANRGMFA